MGCMVDAICPCGYEARDLLEGGGMSGPESERRLARCDRCREIVSVRAASFARGCPRCGGELAPPVECPRCRSAALELVPTGEWD
ncbi:MAG: hypothetical protein FJ108_04825 [Deltaproteobacteria bacterium]|nr:hypothetical protein [Deltaproteobacteria bacterium]